jgi:hypothetical protein
MIITFLKKYLIFLFLIFLLQSCSNKQKTKTNYNPDGKILNIEYYDDNGFLKTKKNFSENGDLISIFEFKKGEKIKMMFYDGNRLVSDLFLEKKDIWNQRIYYDNITIYGNGKIDNQGRQIGWWSFFDNNKILKQKQEFMNIDNNQYLNQAIIFEKNGKIDFKNSFFISLNIKKIKDKIYRCKLNYNNQKSKISEAAICIGNDIKEDFSNVSSVHLDTVNIINKSFPIEFENTGEKIIRGFLLSRYTKNPNETSINEKTVFLESKIYFEYKILVE